MQAETQAERVAVEQVDRDAAWPHRYQGAYGEDSKAAWMSGQYDGSDIIQAFAKHRLAATPGWNDAIEAADGTIERLKRNFDLLLAGRPVRDVDETAAEAATTLAKLRALRREP